jgi:hypothetical protein
MLYQRQKGIWKAYEYEGMLKELSKKKDTGNCGHMKTKQGCGHRGKDGTQS